MGHPAASIVLIGGLLLGLAGGESEPVSAPGRAGPTESETTLDGPGLVERAGRFEAAGDDAGAERDLTEAVAWFRTEGDTAGERRVLVRRGLLRGRRGGLAAAVEDLEAALPLADAGLDREAPPRVRRLIAELHLSHDRAVEALPWADASLIAAAVSARPEFAARPCQTYLEVATALAGDDASVLSALQHVDRRLAEMGGYAGPDTLPEMLFTAGASWLAEGDLDAARSGMELAVRAADVLAEPGQLPPYLTGLGYVAMEQGDLERARAALERCLALPDGRTVAALSSLGAVQRRAGWLDEALGSYDGALELARAERETAEIGPLMGRRADVLELAGRLDEARRERTHALRELGDDGDDGEIICQQVRLARMLVAERRWEEAEGLAMRSLGLNRSPIAVPGAPVRYLSPSLAAEALLVLAAMHAEREEIEDARRELAQAEVTLVRAGRAPERGRVVAARAALELLAGEEEAAATVIDDLPDGAGAHWQVLLARAQVARAAGDRAAGEELLRRAAGALDRETGGVPWEVHPPLLLAPSAVRDERVRLLGEDGRARDLLAVVLSSTEDSATVADGQDSSPQVPPNGAILVLATTADDTWLALVHGEGTFVASSALGRDQLALPLLALHGLPDGGARPRQLALWQTASALLYDTLVRPVEGSLGDGDVERLVIAADRELAGAPLGALWDGSSYLAERFVLSRAPRGGAAPPPYEGKRRSRTATAFVCTAEESSAHVEELRRRVRATEVQSAGALCAGDSEPLGAAVIHVACPVERNPLAPERSRVSVPGRRDLDVAGLAACSLSPRVVVLDPGGDASPLARRVELDLAGGLVTGGAPAVLVAPAAGLDSAGIYREFLKGLDRHGAPEALRRAQSPWFEGGAPAAWAGWECVSW